MMFTSQNDQKSPPDPAGNGCLYAIGTGPGDPDLLTIRAASVLSSLDCLFAPAAKQGKDSLALSIVRDYLSPDTEIFERHFPMSADADAKTAAWDQVAAEMAAVVRQGKKVGFVTLGDAMLFSTWVFLLSRLQGQIPLDIIPGITSFAGIAAASAFPLAMEQQSMAVVSCTAEPAHLREVLKLHACVVLMKVYGRWPQIKALLAEQNLLSHALLMSNASLPDEQCVRDLAALPDDASLSYFSTILVNQQWLSA